MWYAVVLHTDHAYSSAKHDKSKQHISSFQPSSEKNELSAVGVKIYELTEELMRRNTASLQLSSSDYIALSSALQTMSIPLIASCVLSNNELRDEVVRSLMKQLSVEVSKLRSKSGPYVSRALISLTNFCKKCSL
jgi:hypothetical protein